MVRKIYVYVIVMFIFVLSLLNVSALNSNFTVSDNLAFINLGQNNTINISIGAINENITRVELRWNADVSGSPADFFINNSNGSEANGVVFSDFTNYTGYPTRNYLLVYQNISTGGFIGNRTSTNFWISVSARQIFDGAGALLALSINATGISGTSNFTTINFEPGFTFKGYVANETGCSNCWQNGTNVTIYGYLSIPNGPPVEDLLASSLTNESGFFRLSKVNASAIYRGYVLKTLFYNSSGTATKVGSILPDFPARMFYGGGGGGMDMTLNGATFYLQPAATINLYATNGSNQVSFGYELIDQTLGFPIKSDLMSKNNGATVIVPAGRGYAVSFLECLIWVKM